jgi:hypothetical protein
MLLRSETAAPAAGATAVTIARSNSPLLRSRNANLFKGAGPEPTVSTMSGACSLVEGLPALTAAAANCRLTAPLPTRT